LTESAAAGAGIGSHAIGKREGDAHGTRYHKTERASGALVSIGHIADAVRDVLGDASDLDGVRIETRVADGAKHANWGLCGAVGVKSEPAAPVEVKIVWGTSTADVGGRVVVQTVGSIAGEAASSSEDGGRGAAGAGVLVWAVSQTVWLGLGDAESVGGVEAGSASNAEVVETV
jgi:hypothetical protein